MTPPNFPEQIGKLIPRLGSTFHGEVVATARAIEKSLTGAGLDWHALADAIRPTPARLPLSRQRPRRGYSPGGESPIGYNHRSDDWRCWAEFCHRGQLPPNERQFVNDLYLMSMGWRTPSDRQMSWLESIYRRLLKEAA